jgi:hypothetical protein
MMTIDDPPLSVSPKFNLLYGKSRINCNNGLARARTTPWMLCGTLRDHAISGKLVSTLQPFKHKA